LGSTTAGFSKTISYTIGFGSGFGLAAS